MILALRRQRHVDLCEFKVSLVYKESSRIAEATQRDPLLRKKKRAREKEDKPLARVANKALTQAVYIVSNFM